MSDGRSRSILFVSHSSELNGAELWLLDILLRIDRKRFVPLLAVPEDGPLAVRARAAGILTAVVPMAWDLTPRSRIWKQPFARIWNRKAVSSLATLASHDRVDIVFSNSAAMFSGARAARRLGLPHVWAVHEILGGRRPFLADIMGRKRLARRILSLSERVIVNSEATRAAFGGSEKAVFVPNGIDPRQADPERLGALRTEFGIAPGDFVIGVIGKIYPGKGQREALAAAALLATKFPRLRWLVIGAVGDEAYARRIRRDIRAAGIEEKVVFTGYRPDLADLLGLAGAVVIPSVVESFGRAALEAMASGVPVLAVRAGGLPEIVVHGKNGFLLGSREPAEIALGVQYLLEHPGEAAAAAAAGRDTIRERFSVAIQVRAVENVLESRRPGLSVSVILVNFNDWTRLRTCLNSLRAQDPAPEIVVVDNASADGSRELAAVEFPEVRWISMNENAGFGKANNAGVRSAGGDALLFLNTDTVVPAGALKALAARLASDPTASAVGPALLRPLGTFQVSFGRSVGLMGQAFQKLFMNPLHERTLPRSRRVRRVGWLSAACLLCRREAFETAGGFDEDFFLYFEDIDLCARLRKTGKRLIFDPSVRVVHEGGATTSVRSAAGRFEYRRSQVLFYRKHRSAGSEAFLRLLLRAEVRRLARRGAFGGADGAALEARYRRLLKGDASRS